MRRYALTLSPPARCGLNTIRGLYRDPLLLLLGAHVPSNALNLTVIRIQSLHNVRTSLLGEDEIRDERGLQLQEQWALSIQ